MLALGIALAAVSLLLPKVVGVPEPLYSGICAGLLAVGVMALTARGWRAANRLLRDRQQREEGWKR
jgi:hypothetical protein